MPDIQLVEDATCTICGSATRCNMVWNSGWCDQCETWVKIKYAGYHLEDALSDETIVRILTATPRRSPDASRVAGERN